MDPTRAMDQAVGAALVQSGLVSAAQLQEGLARLDAGLRRGEPIRLAHVLVNAGLVTREQILATLAGVDPIVGEETLPPLDASTVFETRPPSPAFPQPLREPVKRLGGYVVLEELGRGGMGVVLKARDPKLDRLVAIKRILSTLRPDSLARFEREARLASKLRHPGIAAVHEIAVEGDQAPYLVMEFVPGVPLKDQCREGELSGRRIGELLVGICAAIAHAHEQGVVHRDLKPHNVMVRPDGAPVVLDFGLARQEDGLSLTETGQLLGTPAYMAPEQASGEKGAISPATDVYGLGSILYECLAGRPPFQGSQVQVINAVLRKAPAPPSSVRKVHRDLETICLKCLEKAPADRYPSAIELGADLERFLEGEPIEAQPVGLLTRLSRRAWRSKTVVVAVVAVAVAAVAVPLIIQTRRDLKEERQRSADELGRETAAKQREEEAKKKEQRWRDELERCTAAVDRLGDAMKLRYRALGRTRQEEARLVATFRRDVQAALAILDAGVRRSPDLATLHVLRAKAYLLLFDLDTALRSAREARKVDPSLREAWLIEGRALIGRVSMHALLSEPDDDVHGLIRAAGKCFERGGGDAELGRRLRVWRALLARKKEEVGLAIEELARTSTSEEVAFVRAVQAGLFAAHVDFASKQLNEALEICPRMFPALVLRGWIQLQSGELDAARQDLDLVLQLNPDVAIARFHRGYLNHLQNRLSEALEDYDVVLRLNPQDVHAYVNRASVHEKLGNTDQAVADLDAALRLRPNMVRGHVGLWVYRAVRGELGELRPTFERLLTQAPHILNFTHGDSKLFDAANRALDELVTRHPRSPEPWEARGHLRLLRGDLLGARLDYRRAIELGSAAGSDIRHAYLGRSVLNAREEKFEAGIRDLEQVLRLDPQDRIARLYRAQTRSLRGQFAQAESELTALIRDHPEFAAAHGARGVARVFKKELTGARLDLDRAVQLDPQIAFPYYQRCLLRRKQGDLRGALQDVDRFLSLAQTDADGWFERGMILYELKIYDRALVAYGVALANRRGYPRAHYNRGLCMVRLKDYAGAEVEFEHTTREAPEYALGYFHLARTRWLQGKRREAVHGFSACIRIDPKNADGWTWRGLVKKELDDFRGAVADCSEAIRLNPEDGAAYYNRGHARHRLGDRSGCIADSTQAIRLGVKTANAYFNRGRARVPSDPRQAVADLTEALRLNPNHAGALVERSKAKKKLGDVDGARADLMRASRVEISGTGGTHGNRGLAFELLGDRKGALAEYEKAVEKDPQSTHARRLLAILKRDMGDLRGSLAEFDVLIELAPQRAESWRLRSWVKRKLGDVNGSLSDLNTAVRLDPDNAYGWERRAYLQLLRADWSAALSDAGQARARLPRDFYPRYYQCLAKLLAGDLRGAHAETDALVRFDPDRPRGYLLRSVLRRLAGDAQGAGNDRRKAKSLETRIRIRGPVAILNTVLKVDPKLSGTWALRGLYKAQAGDFDGAARDLAESLRLAPKQPGANLIRQLIKSCGGD